jgi:hypothetical protein
MISEHVFNHEEVDDFTKDFTASPDQDYITLFIYLKGQEYDEITVGKGAAKAIVELFPNKIGRAVKDLVHNRWVLGDRVFPRGPAPGAFWSTAAGPLGPPGHPWGPLDMFSHMSLGGLEHIEIICSPQ